MQAALMKHRSRLDEQCVNRLYRTAKQAFARLGEVNEQGISVTRTVNGSTVSVACMDEETGLFVQLVGDEDKGLPGSLLTFGQKFCQETRDVQRQALLTKIW
jgi:hypothetical protein